MVGCIALVPWVLQRDTNVFWLFEVIFIAAGAEGVGITKFRYQAVERGLVTPVPEPGYVAHCRCP